MIKVVGLFHFILPCFEQALTMVLGLFQFVSEFSRYIFIFSFVMKQKWAYKKKKKILGKKKKVSVSLFHFVTLCSVTSNDQGLGLFHLFHFVTNRNGFI